MKKFNVFILVTLLTCQIYANPMDFLITNSDIRLSFHGTTQLSYSNCILKHSESNLPRLIKAQTKFAFSTSSFRARTIDYRDLRILLEEQLFNIEGTVEYGLPTTELQTLIEGYGLIPFTKYISSIELLNFTTKEPIDLRLECYVETGMVSAKEMIQNSFIFSLIEEEKLPWAYE